MMSSAAVGGAAVMAPPSVLAAYRQALRPARKLPHEYLRLFFRIKAADDIRSILRTRSDGKRCQKLKRLIKQSRKVESALAGDKAAWTHILDLATGRKGKLRHELLEPLQGDRSVPPPAPLISFLERSRPPVWSPILSALAISNEARTTKALSPKQLQTPASLPARADPESDEARLLGRLSKRREVNIRWRSYRAEVAKIRLPLEAEMGSSTTDALPSPAPLGFGFTGTGLLAELEEAAGPPWTQPQLTRREKRYFQAQDLPLPPAPSEPALPRFIRRRYRELLGRIPVLNWTVASAKGKLARHSYQVGLGPRAIIHGDRTKRDRLPEIEPEDLAWIALEKSNA